MARDTVAADTLAGPTAVEYASAKDMADLKTRLSASEASVRKLQAEIDRLTRNDDRLEQSIADVRSGL